MATLFYGALMTICLIALLLVAPFSRRIRLVLRNYARTQSMIVIVGESLLMFIAIASFVAWIISTQGIIR